MKKIIPIMIALSMLTICFVALDTDSEAVDVGLWVNGHEVTGDTTAYSETEHWTYTASTNTLALNGVTFTTTHSDMDRSISSPIFDGRSDSTLKIVLSGSNTITASDIGSENDGIWVNDKVEISGSGSLSITSNPHGEGIVATDTFTMTSGTVTVTAAHNFDVFCTGQFPSVIGHFIMNGGTLNLNGTGNIDVNGTVVISGGTINSDSGIISILDIGSETGTFSMTGGSLNYSDISAGEFLIEVDRSMDFNGAELPTTVVPKKDDSGWVECDIAQATRLYTTANGNVSISLGDPTYTVTFDANGGTGTMAQVTGVSGEYTLPESTFTAPDGKEFKCWKVGDDEKNAGDKITVSSDITVKAVWKDKSSGGSNNIGLIIGGVIAGIVVVGAVAFFLIKRP